jgi:CRISPR-associated protein Csx17
MDGERRGCENLPLAPAYDALAASPSTIAAFLRGELDDRRIADLLWGLMLVDYPHQHQRGPGSDRFGVDALPPIYCLLKLLFLPRDLIVSSTAGKKCWNLVPYGEQGTHRIRPEPAILALLRAGRVGEAAAIAMRRLRSSGLTPLPHRRSGGPSRDDVWTEVQMSARDGRVGGRLAAALLIPIDPRVINGLVHRATCGEDVDIHSEPPAETVGPSESLAAHDAISTTHREES